MSRLKRKYQKCLYDIHINRKKHNLYHKKMSDIKNRINEKIMNKIKKQKYTIKKKEFNNGTYLDRKSDSKLGIG